MKKDIGWLESCFDDEKSYPGGYVKYKIDQLDVVKNLSQERPVLPKFVAEWIEEYTKYGYDLYPALKKMENNSRTWERIYKWYRMNTYKFVNAYLTGKYEIEEGPLYHALIKGHELMTDEDAWTYKYWNLSVPDGRVFPSDRFSVDGKYSTEMSKSKWNEVGINDTNADFVKVEE